MPTLLNRPIRISPTIAGTDGRLVAAITRVQYRSATGNPERVIYRTSLGLAARNAAYNSGLFAKVLLLPQPLPDGTGVFIDIDVLATEEGGAGWWWLVAWPAILPIPGAWPVQPKLGRVSAILTVRLRKPGGMWQTLRIEKVRDYSIFFYSFYRTTPIEERMQLCFEDALNALTEQLPAAIAGLAANAAPAADRKAR